MNKLEFINYNIKQKKPACLKIMTHAPIFSPFADAILKIYVVLCHYHDPNGFNNHSYVKKCSAVWAVRRTNEIDIHTHTHTYARKTLPSFWRSWVKNWLRMRTTQLGGKILGSDEDYFKVKRISDINRYNNTLNNKLIVKHVVVQLKQLYI